MLSHSVFGSVTVDAPDLVILNAKIYNAAGKKLRSDGIAIRNGRITKIDASYKIRRMTDRGTRSIDARGKLVVPGFNDSHTHFMAIGNLFSSIDLRDVRRREEIPQRMREYVRFLPRGRWILGGNWNNTDWISNSMPTRNLIDDSTPDNPVFVYGPNSNIALANGVALRMAGIDRDTTVPRGGEVITDREGNPTGVLKGSAILLVRALIPRLATKQDLEVAETASNYAAALGVTSVQDMHSDYIADVFRELRRIGKLKTRIYDCTPLYDWRKLAAKGIRSASGDEFVREGCLKSFAFSDTGATDELFESIKGADKAGLQVMIHAIGSSANHNILNTFERVEAVNGNRDRRFRSEHAARFGSRDIRRFGRLGVIPSMQPHLFGGYEPYRSLINSGARIAFGSDASMTDFNPLQGIHDAVNRGTPEERLTVSEAIGLYTLGSAYAEFQEKEKGSIERGRLADLVILSENIFSIPSSKIRDASVIMTIVGGEIVYDRRTG